jgi:hypothetical protein
VPLGVLYQITDDIKKAVIGSVWQWLQLKGTQFLEGMSVSVADVSWMEGHYEITFYPKEYIQKVRQFE